MEKETYPDVSIYLVTYLAWVELMSYWSVSGRVKCGGSSIKELCCYSKIETCDLMSDKLKLKTEQPPKTKNKAYFPFPFHTVLLFSNMMVLIIHLW